MPLVSGEPLLLVFRLPSAQAPTSCGETPISPAWVMSQLSGERMYQMFASLSEQERNRFLNQVQANPTFEGVERLQGGAIRFDGGRRGSSVRVPSFRRPRPQEMGMDFMDTVATEDMPVPASDAEAVHPLVVAAPPAQTPAPAACPALSKAKQGLPVPMKTPPPRAGDDGQTHAPPKLWPKQGASSSAGTPKVPAVDKAKPASPKTAEPKVIAKEKARPPPLVPEETEIQEEPPLPAPAAPPTEPTPPKTSFPPAAGEARHTPKASFPPAAGEISPVRGGSCAQLGSSPG